MNKVKCPVCLGKGMIERRFIRDLIPKSVKRRAVQLYRTGMSLRKIAVQLNLSKTPAPESVKHMIMNYSPEDYQHGYPRRPENKIQEAPDPHKK